MKMIPHLVNYCKVHGEGSSILSARLEGSLSCSPLLLLLGTLPASAPATAAVGWKSLQTKYVAGTVAMDSCGA